MVASYLSGEALRHFFVGKNAVLATAALIFLLSHSVHATRLVPYLPESDLTTLFGAGLISQDETDYWPHPEFGGCLQATTAVRVELTLVAWIPGDQAALRMAVNPPPETLTLPTDGTPPKAVIHAMSPTSCPRVWVHGIDIAEGAAYILQAYLE